MKRWQAVLLFIGLMLFGLYLSRRTKGEDSIYLIPSGYRGECIIVWDQPNGTVPEYEDDWRVYRAPQTGVLYTQMSENTGTLKFKYFYLDSLDNRTEIRYLWPTDSCISNEVVVVNHESGGVVQSLFVGNYLEIESDSLGRAAGLKRDSVLREVYHW